LFRAFYIQDGQGKRLFRPVSRLTLAINWYFGKANVVGYHVVNVLIHFLTAFFLFLTILEVLGAPRLKDKFRGKEHFIALMASTLWAIHPIQTQAVTYIVQRMASLSTMFYVLAIFFYIKGRIAHPISKKFILFFCCLLGFFLALASKENAAILPISLILVEICFFKDLGKPGTRKAFGWAFLGGTLLLVGLSTVFMHGNPFSFLQAYEDRPFTLCQRLLTEPRVLVLYLTQIFYPVPPRLSIEHDISVSTSLFSPLTTLPCMVIILLLIGLGLSQIRKRPVLAFGVLFFFLNHIIESSVLGLELVFEHRNHLPSLFLFFPVATGVIWILDYYNEKKSSMYYVLISFVTLMLIGLGMGTYIRNMAWATEKTLWEDAMAKAPKSARPPHNLAWGYYEVVGQYDKAMELYEKSFLLEWHSNSHRANALYGMAGIYFKKGEYVRAVELYRKALSISQKDEMTYQQLALSLMRLGRWDEALKNIEILLLWRPKGVKYLNLKGFVLLKQKRPEEAILDLKKCLKLDRTYRKALINMGAALSFIAEYKRAELFLRRAYVLYPKDALILLWLIETNLKAGDKGDVDRYMDRLFALVRVNGFISIAKRLSNHDFMVPVSESALIQQIIGRFEEKSREIEELETLVNSQQR
jgi:tetratricopeptide (TPR) repeat protein